MMSVLRSLVNATCEPPRTVQRTVPRSPPGAPQPALRATAPDRRCKRGPSPFRTSQGKGDDPPAGPPEWSPGKGDSPPPGLSNSNGLSILNQDHDRLQKAAAGRLADRQERPAGIQYPDRPGSRVRRNRAI